MITAQGPAIRHCQCLKVVRMGLSAKGFFGQPLVQGLPKRGFGRQHQGHGQSLGLVLPEFGGVFFGTQQGAVCGRWCAMRVTLWIENWRAK